MSNVKAATHLDERAVSHARAPGRWAQLFQFRHLSFQEGLFAMSIVEGETGQASFWSDKKQVTTFMKEHVNVCRIGGAQLGNVLFAAYSGNAGALDLSESELGDVGAEALAHLVETSTNWTSLSLYRNDIRREGVKALAKALRVNTVLTSVSRRGNLIFSEGVALAEALRVNAALKKCDLSYNGMDEEAKAVLQDAVKGREGLELIL
jgi:hypothetical protein